MREYGSSEARGSAKIVENSTIKKPEIDCGEILLSNLIRLFYD